MDTQFWLERWENNQIGFHKDVVNPALIDNVDKLALTPGSRIFLPLCGKTLDCGWLLSRGYRVAGSELSESAIEQLFKGLGAEPEVSQTAKLKLYQAENIDIFAGDFFDLSARTLGTVDATYDRAALIAFPEHMRKQYTAHLMTITHKARQLLVSFQYEPNPIEGPPFSVNEEEVSRLYGASYALDLISSRDIPEGYKDKYPAKEKVWMLRE